MSLCALMGVCVYAQWGKRREYRLADDLVTVLAFPPRPWISFFLRYAFASCRGALFAETEGMCFGFQDQEFIWFAIN